MFTKYFTDPSERSLMWDFLSLKINAPSSMILEFSEACQYSASHTPPFSQPYTQASVFTTTSPFKESSGALTPSPPSINVTFRKVIWVIGCEESPL